MAALLLLTLRGTPTLYYGDELGMCDVPIPAAAAQDPWDGRRDPVRTPMRWDDGPNAGFCPPGAAPWLPLGDDAARVNVAAQRADPHSLLALYRRLLALRRGRPDLALGGYEPVAAADGLLAYRRDGLLVALNLGLQERTLEARGRVLVDTGLRRAGAAVEGRVRLAGGEGVVLEAAG